jgi:ADP-ribose pyrophosphatase
VTERINVPDNDKRIIWQGSHLDLVMRGNWEFVERKNLRGIVCIVALTDDGKIVLVEQYRPPVASRVIELPAGLVGDLPGQEAEPLEAAARRELIEETGYDAGRIEQVFDGVPSAGLCDEHITFFLATGLAKVGPGGGDHHEDIAVHEAPLDGLLDYLDARARTGVKVDVKIFSPLYVIERKKSHAENAEGADRRRD